MRSCLVIGHRGASGTAPENTMASFESALAAGADMIELDVQETVDNHLVCIHDYDVSRTTNGSGLVHDFTIAELRQLDAGNGERIPLLSDVLDFAKNRISVNIELKVFDIEKSVVDMVVKRSMESQVLVSSFLHESLKATKEKSSRIQTGVLVNQLPDDVVEYCIDLGAEAINPLYTLLTPELTQSILDSDLQIFPWTVNDEREIMNLLDMSVSGIITDYPEKAVLLVDKFKREYL